MSSIILRRVEQAIKDGLDKNHRRLFVLVGKSDEKLCMYSVKILQTFHNLWRSTTFIETKGIYMYQHDCSDSCRRLDLFKKELGHTEHLIVNYRPYKETDQLLGLTFDFAILDLIDNLKPNDIGRLGGIVRGGGIYILMIPPLELWLSRLTKFQETLLVPQYTPKDVRHFLKLRFWNKLLSHECTLVIDVDKSEIIKDVKIEISEKWRPKELRFPEKMRIPAEIYRLAKTQDQVNALKLMEVLIDKPRRGEKVNIILIADRGRGKSAIIGLALAGICHRIRKAKGFVRIGVTAMNLMNVSTLMEFLVIGLKELGYDPIVEKSDAGVETVRIGSTIFIDYYRPYSIIQEDGLDIVVVDEAAMIPLPILYAVHARFNRVIYASTIHGYEGAGRGFSLRFLKYLREQKNTKIFEYELKEPIRYAENDPVERWLFDTFLLDAEPAKIESNDLELVKNLKVSYVIPEMSKFFLENENELRQFFGIYVQAHYRNEPDDLGMMMDAPHHFIRALALNNGKIVVSVELAEEGGISDDILELMVKGLKLPGNIIPDRLVKYWKLVDFAKLKGWRIVRIATHPELQGRGLGTEMLKEIEDEAKRRGVDWVGVGFGVHERLLRFWIKNGYMPVHMSPERNPISGEYSVLLVKPISEEAKKAVMYANREFRIRLLNSLHGPYHDLEPDVALLLLTDWNIGIDDSYDAKLTNAQINRLIAYAWGPMTYENSADAIFELVKTYYYRSSKRRPKLPKEYQMMMIAKVLQSRPWKETASILNIRKVTLMLGLREVVKTLLHYFYPDIEIPLYMVSTTRGLK
ncbi:MAG: ATPase [Thermoprotei archaeon ex4572_64]|nr:MAG: ATPase [Thermoprotei archaeon ex4572_64]